MDQVNLASWAGREECVQGEIAPAMAAMLAATLGHDPVPVAGDVLPPLWHWSAFLPTVPNSELSQDGHPALGGFLPPVPLNRRMWAGGALEFVAPLHVGETMTRRSRIAAVTEKEGAVGPMVFVTVEHEIDGGAGLAVRETQDIVYLDIPVEFTPPRKVPLPTDAELAVEVPVNEALLFRYSACTFNAHRIHYDLPYAQAVERYPGLVVHGPLQATLLLAAACRAKGSAPVRFRFRGVHPLFHTDGLLLRGQNDGNGMILMAGARDGHQTMQASATWEENT